VGAKVHLRRSRGTALCLAMLFAIGTAGCAASSYAGIPLSPGATAPDLLDLARRARAGDKSAQLGLAVRFEEGQGIARDFSRAIVLYRRAGTDTGGLETIYLPSGRGAAVTAVPVSKGPAEPGLPEARARLAALLERVAAGAR
jgi:TPR repeat protein